MVNVEFEWTLEGGRTVYVEAYGKVLKPEGECPYPTVIGLDVTIYPNSELEVRELLTRADVGNAAFETILDQAVTLLCDNAMFFAEGA